MAAGVTGSRTGKGRSGSTVRRASSGDATADLSAPLLMLLAGDDDATPQEEFEALAAGFEGAGKEYEMHVYDGAPHSFFDVTFGDWEPSCADAWGRISDFTARNARGVARSRHE